MRYWLSPIAGVWCLALMRMTTADSWIVPTNPGPSNNFGANLVWSEGSIATLQWTTIMDYYSIDLYQQELDPPSGVRVETIYSAVSNGSGDQKYEWRVSTYDSDVDASPVYFFWPNPNGRGNTSHYFNITTQDSDDTTTGRTSSTLRTTTGDLVQATNPSSSGISTENDRSASSALGSRIMSDTEVRSTSEPLSSSPTQTSSETSIEDSVTSAIDSEATLSPASAPAQNSDSETNQTTLKVGFGVGLGVGIPLILLAGVWIGLKVVKQRRANARGQSPSVPLTRVDDQKDDFYAPPYIDAPRYQRHQLHEAYSEPGFHEAPGYNRSPVELSSER